MGEVEESPLREEEATVYQVPAGQRVSVGSPAIMALPSGKILVAFDQMGPDVKTLTGKKGHDTRTNHWMQGRVMISADDGKTWKLSATYPFRRASLLRDGGDVYLLGEAEGALQLMRSPDGGGSWSAPMNLTEPCGLRLSSQAILAADGQWVLPCLAPTAEGHFAPQIWRAPRGASLMNRKAWSAGPIAAPLSALVPVADADNGMALPLGKKPVAWHSLVFLAVPPKLQPWLPDGAGLLLGATESGRCHWSAFLRAAPDGTAALAEAAQGVPWCWLPVPGGHVPFDIFFDDSLHQFVLLGQQEPFALTPQTASRVRRLGLWFSSNLMDWHDGGSAVPPDAPQGSRRDPAATVVGANLCLAYVVGGAQPETAKEAGRIGFSRVPNFRARRKDAR